MPKAKPAGTHFVVERLNWRPTWGRFGKGTYIRHPGATRIASFASAAEAEAFLREQEDRARAVVNPFAGALAPADVTSMPEAVLCDWLLDHGTEPPRPAGKKKVRPWAAWWEKSAR